MKEHAAARTLVLLVSASVVVVACTSGHHAAAPASTTAAPAPSSTTVAPTRSTAPSATSRAPSSTVSATTTTTALTAQQVLSALRTDRFDGSDLPAHLHVVGVGPWQYVDAGHVGGGNLGSAHVSLRSDASGEKISGVYDVFTTPAAASVDFAHAYSNFRTYSSETRNGVSVLHLHPAVDAFCGPQVPVDATTCWFVHGATTGNVDATIPSTANAGDNQAVVQAMLTHLLALGG
jgi:hypothetical protein